MSMTDESERMGRILDILAITAVKGKIAARVARGLHEAYENGRITCSRRFFETAYETSIDRMVLFCYRLLVTAGAQRDSVSVEYLLNCAGSNPGVFPFAKPGDVQRSVDEHRQVLDEMRPLSATVARERNWSLAHVDRKWVNNPELVLSMAPLFLGEVERSYGILLDLINVYKGYFDNVDFQWQHLDGEVHADLDYLWSVIGRSNAPIPE